MAILGIAASHLLYTVTRISSETTDRFFSKLVWDVSLVTLLCKPDFGSCSPTNMATVGQLVFFPLSHLLRNQWRNFVKTFHMDSSQPLDVSPRKCFRSVDYYGRQMAILDIATYISLLQSLYHLVFSHYLISSVTSRKKMSKLCIWIPLNPTAILEFATSFLLT